VDLPKQTPALYTENEWPNFKEYIVAVEEEEWDKDNMNKLGGPLKRNLKP